MVRYLINKREEKKGGGSICFNKLNLFVLIKVRGNHRLMGEVRRGGEVFKSSYLVDVAASV